jgi:hypothetical protein
MMGLVLATLAVSTVSSHPKSASAFIRPARRAHFICLFRSPLTLSGQPVGDPEDLKRIIEKLCGQLATLLEARGIGARRLDLVFLRVDNIAQAAGRWFHSVVNDPQRSCQGPRPTGNCSRDPVNTPQYYLTSLPGALP